MNCPKCKTQLPADASFCFSCGQHIESPANTRNAEEVELKWLVRCFEKDGYECPLEDIEENRFFARHT